MLLLICICNPLLLICICNPLLLPRLLVHRPNGCHRHTITYKSAASSIHSVLSRACCGGTLPVRRSPASRRLLRRLRSPRLEWQTVQVRCVFEFRPLWKVLHSRYRVPHTRPFTPDDAGGAAVQVLAVKQQSQAMEPLSFAVCRGAVCRRLRRPRHSANRQGAAKTNC
jgi:hypothetical protein